MFCEGYYLHRLISKAFEPPKSLLAVYFIGWGKWPKLSVYIDFTNFVEFVKKNTALIKEC